MTRAQILFFIVVAAWLSMAAWLVFVLTGGAHQVFGARMVTVTLALAAVYAAVRIYLSLALRKALKA